MHVFQDSISRSTRRFKEMIARQRVDSADTVQAITSLPGYHSFGTTTARARLGRKVAGRRALPWSPPLPRLLNFSTSRRKELDRIEQLDRAEELQESCDSRSGGREEEFRVAVELDVAALEEEDTVRGLASEPHIVGDHDE